MTTHATGSFEIDSWDQDALDGPVERARAAVRKTFTGDLVGTSSVDVLMAVGSQPGSAGYVASELVTGRLHDREGSFVLLHVGLSDRGDASATWTIVPDSGTGELVGIRGSSTIERHEDGSHTYTFDYDLHPAGESPG